MRAEGEKDFVLGRPWPLVMRVATLQTVAPAPDGAWLHVSEKMADPLKIKGTGG